MDILPDAVAALELTDESGQKIPLGSLKPAVIVWLRHFGCIFCREQASQFAARLGDIEARGSRLVFVSSGAHSFAKAFREDFFPNSPSIVVLSDPERKSYRALGFRRGFASLFRRATVMAGLRAFRAGFRQALKPQGDTLQNGGVLVVDGTSHVRYRFVSDASGHHPEPDAVVAALGLELLLY
jgi:peroxiredoxin